MSQELLPDKIYYSIAELSDHFGVAKSLLRYWEKEFDTIKPKRNKKGTRFYSKQDVDQIRLIYHLVKEKGHTLEGARTQLKRQKKKVKNTVEAKESLLRLRQFLIDLKDNL
ncbi:MAG: MerR family transcriptional regulator [Bacteroidia bacterium]|nr:MerR family transcriptional regulator [Bacteroidia bacterium]